MSKQKFWNEEEIFFLIDNYPIYGSKYCAEKLSRSLASVRTKAKIINIKRDGIYRYNRKDAPEGYQYCGYCDQILPEGFFYKKSKNGSYGKKTSFCRSCVQQKSRKHYRNNSEKILRRLNENPIKILLKNIKSRAKIKKIDFNLTEEDIIIPNFCPVLNIEIIPFDNSDNSPSVDRFDNNKGYIKGNCYIISKRANRLKSNGTIDEFKKIIDYMKSH